LASFEEDWEMLVLKAKTWLNGRVPNLQKILEKFISIFNRKINID